MNPSEYDPNKSYPAIEMLVCLNDHVAQEMRRVAEFGKLLREDPNLRVAGQYLISECCYNATQNHAAEMFKRFMAGNSEMLGHLESIKAGTHHQHPHGEAIRKLERRAAVRRQPKAKIKVRK